jgi:hypothetical protein
MRIDLKYLHISFFLFAGIFLSGCVTITSSDSDVVTEMGKWQVIGGFSVKSSVDDNLKSIKITADDKVLKDIRIRLKGSTYSYVLPDNLSLQLTAGVQEDLEVMAEVVPRDACTTSYTISEFKLLNQSAKKTLRYNVTVREFVENLKVTPVPGPQKAIRGPGKTIGKLILESDKLERLTSLKMNVPDGIFENIRTRESGTSIWGSLDYVYVQLDPGKPVELNIIADVIKETEGTVSFTLSDFKFDNVQYTGTLDFDVFVYAATNLFGPAVKVSEMNYPYISDVALGDFNGDGLNDIAAISSKDNSPVYMFFQGPDHKISGMSTLALDQPAYSLVADDFTGDNLSDLLISQSYYTNTLDLYRQLNPVTIPPFSKTNISSGYGIEGLTLSDINKDGLGDVVGYSSDPLIGFYYELMYQSPSGCLSTPVRFKPPYGGFRFALGDVNGDGLPDIVTIAFNKTPIIEVSKGTPSGFAFDYTIPLAGFGPEGIAVGDVNGDGLEDVVLTYNWNVPDSRILILLQGQDHKLVPQEPIESFDLPRNPVIVDINGDGKKDIVIAHGSYIGVYLQGENGTLLPEQIFWVDYIQIDDYHRSIVVGDVNGDGKPDVVIGGIEGVFVLYNYQN